jgi:hypothetical protein
MCNSSAISKVRTVLAQSKLSRLCNKPEFDKQYISAVSLHSHTNRSKESLHFIPKFTRKHPILHWALERQAKRSTIPVDLVNAYWTPPLPPKAAFEVEKNQIERVLGLMALVSLTDHDTIEAPTLLRMVADTKEVPFALEWSVPFGEAIFHLGVHNLPSSRAQELVADLADYTRIPSDSRLSELLAMLDECPDVLVVFNHPLWDLGGMGQQRCREILDQFLLCNVRFLHAFELNATRSRIENNGVIELAGRWRRLLISGGDRHGCEPSGALNLTRAESFCEFVREIRVEQRSHVLIMPQYDEPLTIRTLQTVLDVIREYPEYAPGCRRWDDRVFHPHQTTNTGRPISALWNAPPAYIERVFLVMRLLENAPVRRALRQIFRSQVNLRLPSDNVYEASL